MSQRESSTATRFCLALAAGILIAGDFRLKAEEKEPVTANTAFARLKKMAGTWSNKISGMAEDHHEADGKVIYRLTGAGSALIETDFPEAAHEMVSVYHLDGNDLRMTHYCAAGNQPRMKLDPSASSADKYVFVFDGGSNLDSSKDMHIHGLTMSFQDDGKVVCRWEAYQGGKSAGLTTFELTRPKP